MDARGFFARVTSDTSQQSDKPLVAISSRHAWNGILVQDNFRYSVLKILQFLGILESNEEKMGYWSVSQHPPPPPPPPLPAGLSNKQFYRDTGLPSAKWLWHFDRFLTWSINLFAVACTRMLYSYNSEEPSCVQIPFICLESCWGF